MAYNYRRTKIVCTLGPATASKEMIEQLIQAGMDVVRLNFSHGSHESHKQKIEDIREISRKLGREVGILQDLSGPKIRLGELEGEVTLESGQTVILGTPEDCACQACADGPLALPVTYPYIFEDVEVNNRILLADGLVELKVTDKCNRTLVCEVIAGGKLSSHKGVNLPTSNLRTPAFTEKDKDDLEFGLKLGVDFVAMSFVRHEDDLTPVKERLQQTGLARPPLLIAKIEKPQALERLPQILAQVDGIMVARGDLGVEMPLEQVPIIQKRLIREARIAGKVVITATQMLRSMMENPRPTRAEANDVANAILDGTDAVMLSDETAVGEYPVEAVRVLHRVSLATEPNMLDWRFLENTSNQFLEETSSAISHAVCLLACELKPSAIVATTGSGSTARLISRYRPAAPLMGLSSSLATCRQLCLSWGVEPVLNYHHEDMKEMVESALHNVVAKGMAKTGHRVIITAGFPLGEPGSTSLIKVSEVE